MRWNERMVYFAALVVALASAPALAQTPNLDATKVDAAHHKVEFENEYVRIVRYVFAPHEKAPMHEHPSLVKVLVSDENARSTTPDGKTSDVHGKAGTVAWRTPTVHAYENVSDARIEGVLVEPKGPGNPAWKPPEHDSVKMDPAHNKVEFENDQVRVERFAFAKGEKAAMHDHAANVQIMLTDANQRVTTPDGKLTQSVTKAGTVRYRDALSHAVENTGDRVEGIVVVLKGAPVAKTAGK